MSNLSERFFPKKPEYLDNLRRTGRTTRIADAAIQTFFITGQVIVQDHYFETSSGNEHLLKVIVNRLKHEHNVNCVYMKQKRGYLIKPNPAQMYGNL